ncbi:MAG: hypothetical protein DRP71_11580 [Verrucomicrobia bacterium]|nr:MAG: hypothetical protein DRP71_11580 [Verrucomicrobiota bacterium]
MTVLVGLGGPCLVSRAEGATLVKDYILYTGGNLQVLDGDEKHPIVGVSPFTITIRRKGRFEKIPLDKVGRLWIDREMKLNRQSAAISNLLSRKAYTPGHEEVADWGSIRTGDLSSGQSPLDNVQGNFFEDSVTIQKDRASIGRSRGALTSSTGGSGLLDRRGGEGGGTFDALEVTLELASRDSIIDPYLVLVTDFRDPAVPDQFFRKFRVRVLDGISREPVSIQLLQGGFPVGFEVDEFNIYLYSGGREIPTTLSDKQVALTADEAFQYLILEYLIGHKGETLVPRPMWVGMPFEVKEQIRGLETNPEVNLILDAKGRVVDLTIRGGELGPDIIAAFRAFRFYPALETGKSVEGSYALKPKELVR